MSFGQFDFVDGWAFGGVKNVQAKFLRGDRANVVREFSLKIALEETFFPSAPGNIHLVDLSNLRADEFFPRLDLLFVLKVGFVSNRNEAWRDF
jgi:hypothetical protein